MNEMDTTNIHPFTENLSMGTTNFVGFIYIQLFHEFHTNAKLSYGINSSFMVLIPKRDSPSGLGDYRPISLVSSIYKILAKVLSKRIKQVLPAVISEVQSTFVSGRHILDGVLIANEVIDGWHRARKKGIILKLDFKKAYDSLSWDFLLSMLGSFGFEARAIEKDLFKGASVGSDQLGISHLQFADDTIIFCEGGTEEVFNIKRVLRCFEVISGLRINFHKSVVCGVGFNEDQTKEFAKVLNCLPSKLPINFLGLPLGENPRMKSTWDPIVAKFQKKLSSWKMRLLSYAGRLTLIKSTLSNLPIYFLSIFKMPKGVVKAISKIQANFLWGSSAASRKVHMVKWKEVTKGKNQGGLGIRDLGVVNECLLLKWWWRYGSEDKALWKEVICCRYGKMGRGWSPLLSHPVGVSLVWKDISQLSTVNQQLGEFFGEQVQLIVSNGRRIKLWYDPWLGGRGLKDEFTRLFSLSIENEDSLQQISAKIGASGRWQLQFRRPLLAWEEEELQRLVGMLLFTPRLRDGVEDSCSWLAEKSSQFTVASIWRWRAVASGNNLVVPAGVWESLAPPKMQFFCWLAWRGRVKTSSFLQRIGALHLGASNLCVFCQAEVETIEHVLLMCPLLYVVYVSGAVLVYASTALGSDLGCCRFEWLLVVFEDFLTLDSSNIATSDIVLAMAVNDSDSSEFSILYAVYVSGAVLVYASTALGSDLGCCRFEWLLVVFEVCVGSF
ncbi:uncharacterized protein LOC114302016 [Camellia sinensis]|uniref:uncharacterized protein LOC114302016 n=1 Tax=Camellia sinensis TaxID=4442 RepID=UPI001036961A|nr:uncharacterized protein LOC114302016 [Camellia sinensis]